MEMLDKYLALRAEIFDYFGYVEDWRVLPIDDRREMLWQLEGDGDDDSTVRFAETAEKMDSDGDYYEDEIYKQRHLPKWVFRGADYTLVVVDTHTDGNQFLAIFANALERH